VAGLAREGVGKGGVYTAQMEVPVHPASPPALTLTPVPWVGSGRLSPSPAN